jgi:pyruvyl transferase EpsI
MRRKQRKLRDAGSPTSGRVLIRHAAPNRFLKLINNIYFVFCHLPCAFQPKLAYLLTPPPWIQNVGDQAQVVAILSWLQRSFPRVNILECNQSESCYFLPALKCLIRTRDLIFLHSGGNLGDRYMGIELPRRLIIEAFPDNKIVSLPQTICFSNTEDGRIERSMSSRIYDSHPNLAILCRDRVSARTAAKIFNNATIHCVPDFVLSLPVFGSCNSAETPKVLICRRLDRESIYSEVEWNALVARLPLPSRYFDTRLPEPIEPHQRKYRLAETLNLFSRHQLVVTDRFHGIVFAILCRVPCVALPTIDHKVTASRFWFRGVLYAAKLDEVPSLAAQALQRGFVEEENWNRLYFDWLTEILGVHTSREIPSTADYTELKLADRWEPVTPYQKPQQYSIAADCVTFHGTPDTQDEWCFLRAQGGPCPWRNFEWHFQFCRHSHFREFAFNFRFQDFSNRYRYRFEAGRLYFDKRFEGRWHNHLTSVPFEIKLDVWYRVRIAAFEDCFECFIDERLIMKNMDSDIASGIVAIILWETDGRTPLAGAVKDARIRIPRR